MKGNFKALGLAILAAFAMSAVVASSAHATQASFTAESYPVTITGTQEGATNYFEATPGRKVECKIATYEGTLKEASTELTVTPTYDECTETSTGFGATVDLNGCHYIFTVGTKTSSTDAHGEVHVKCPVGNKISITVATCTVHVTPQTRKVTYTNLPANVDTPKKFVTVDVDVTNEIHYEDTDGFLCPFEGNSTGTNGSFVSNVRVKGYKDPSTHINANLIGIDVG